ncbi:MAG: membrane or secreted protein [Thermoguttaceae bacterium]|jgi:hypothetical protein
MYKIPTAAILLLLFFGLAGCQSTAKPSLAHPGSAQTQQNRAVRFDPYPENDIGPALVGVRPRDYENPIPEPARARWQVGNQSQ